MNKKLFQENIWKHAGVFILIMFAYPVIDYNLKTLDVPAVGNFLILISILLVSVCFANFAFTYKDSDLEQKATKYLSHATTALFLFLTGTLLTATCIAFTFAYPTLAVLLYAFSFLLYIGFVLYDFWDLLRNS